MLCVFGYGGFLELRCFFGFRNSLFRSWEESILILCCFGKDFFFFRLVLVCFFGVFYLLNS